MVYDSFKRESGIYQIRNSINGKVYIGQSVDVRRRISNHYNSLQNNNHFNIHLQNAWNQYGSECFEFDVIEYCDIEALNDREVYYIQKHNATNPNYGYNILDGGNSYPRIFTLQTRMKMSQNHADFSGERNPMYGKSLRDVMGEEAYLKWKEKISQNNSGSGNPFYGRHHTEETKALISKANKGKFSGEKNPHYGIPIDPELLERLTAIARTRTGDNATNPTKIICLNTGEVFGSIKTACDKYSLNSSAVSHACSGKSYSCGMIDGIRLAWAYYDDYIKMSEEEIKNRLESAINADENKMKKLRRQIRCLTTHEIFNSVSEAAEYYNLDKSSVVKCAKGKLKSCGKDKYGNKLVWEYAS